ncbi:ParA family protein [Vulcaniibacterium tengchongense]|uniref:Chromosome partitioning protein n=1 Tax=Vulcaniibacterium tengchongense TaxID=1273429 RepID=A0A3N4VAP9_9GAMM|nr:ParA family protein [Vulcaniibacterium tengchongense]RPE80062.1 chromosome partitioning protein [Vulcaniibacterium tengchongense]
MKTVLVASSKGGVGKTTIVTHLAAQAALDGLRTVLVDADPQGSSTRWAQRRAALDSAVLPLDGTRRKAWRKQLPDDAQRLLIDAPAGAMGEDLEPFLEQADAVVVPVQPSALDIEASVPFLDSLARHPRVRRGELRVGLVGNRLKPWTNATQQALELLAAWPYPLVAQLRDSQAYVVLVGLGKSLFDYQSLQVREHQADWQPLLRWLKKA